MTRQEWADFCAEVDNTFKGDLTEDKEAIYFRHLADLPVDVARAALRLLVSEGMAWMPAPGEIAAAVRKLARPAHPPFGEAWPIITRALDRHWSPSAGPEEQGRRRLAIVTEVGAHLGEGPARWVERTLERLVIEPASDPDVGGAVRYRLEQEYERSCQQADEDRRVGLALERAGVRKELGRPGLRRINGGRALPELPEEVA